MPFFGHLKHQKDYFNYLLHHQIWHDVFERLANLPHNMDTGQHLLTLASGQEVKAAVMNSPNAPPRLFEAHQVNIDVHFILAGTEYLRYRTTTLGMTRSVPYNPTTDVALFDNNLPSSLTVLTLKQVAIFLPDEPHLPMHQGTSTDLHKVVIKVPTKLLKT